MHQVIDWVGWDYIAVGSSALGLVASLLFVIDFKRRTGKAWRDNPFGRFLMVRKALLACLFTLVLFNRFQTGGVVQADAWAGQSMVTAVLWTAFALQTFIPYKLLVEAQHELRPRIKEVPSDHR